MNDDLNNDSDIIFNFFQKLTNGDLQPSKEMKIGFGVYYSQERRKKILDAILGNRNKEANTEGKRILNNYRAQLQEQMKQLKTEHAEMINQGRVPD